MSQPTPERQAAADETQPTMDAMGSGIPGAPSFTGAPNQHITPQQRAGELIYYLQQAQQECRADAERVEDTQAQRLFRQIADALEQPLQALYHFEDGATQPQG